MGGKLFTPPPHLSDLTENGFCGTARESGDTNYCQTMLFSHNHDHSSAWQCHRPHLDGGRQISTGQMNTALFTGLVLSGSSSQAPQNRECEPKVSRNGIISSKTLF